ncbi:MAG: tetratricopeptide repeat protein [Chitinivibrionales bacterium]|nr:tetratricopeptide repeat protein [Chitinivibrionales bacterium]
MKELFEQEQEKTTQQLRAMLQSIEPPAKSDEEWQRLSVSIFKAVPPRKSLLEAVPGYVQTLREYAAALQWPSPAIVATAVVCLCLFTIGIISLTPSSLPYAKVTRIQGIARITAGNQSILDESRIDPNSSLATKIRKGQRIETGPKSTLTAQLDPGTGFELSDNAEFNILTANKKHFSAFLKSGTMLAQVNKRSKGQTFTILTDNAECKIRGTIFKVHAYNEIQGSTPVTEVSVLEGKIEVIDRKDVTNTGAVESGAILALRGNEFFSPTNTIKKGAFVRDAQRLAFALQASEDINKATGLIEINSRPYNAEVFINGESCGKTPLMVEKPAGDYAISLHYLNHQPWDTSVIIRKSAICNLDPSLKRTLPVSVTLNQPVVSLEKKAKRIRKPVAKKQLLPPEETQDIKYVAVTSIPAFNAAATHLKNAHYKEALDLLNTIKNRKDITNAGRMKIFEFIVICHEKLGTFTLALNTLEKMFELSTNPVKRDNILWKIITIKELHLHDQLSLEADLVRYLITNPKGTWLYEAYAKLAEVQHKMEKYEAAAKAYRSMIKRFPRAKTLDGPLYALATILRNDLDEYSGAISFYTRLLKDYPQSSQAEDALFWRAECYSKLGRARKAQKEYERYLALFPQGRWNLSAQNRIPDPTSPR